MAQSQESDEAASEIDLQVCEHHGLLYDGRYTDKCAQCQMTEAIKASRERVTHPADE